MEEKEDGSEFTFGVLAGHSFFIFYSMNVSQLIISKRT
jgi:hypothetical protein